VRPTSKIKGVADSGYPLFSGLRKGAQPVFHIEACCSGLRESSHVRNYTITFCSRCMFSLCQALPSPRPLASRCPLCALNAPPPCRAGTENLPPRQEPVPFPTSR